MTTIIHPDTPCDVIYTNGDPQLSVLHYHRSDGCTLTRAGCMYLAGLSDDSARRLALANWHRS